MDFHHSVILFNKKFKVINDYVHARNQVPYFFFIFGKESSLFLVKPKITNIYGS
jgi:hypothetical protein